MARLFIFGLGYTAQHVRLQALAQGWQVIATGREGDLPFADDAAVRAGLATADHVVSSVPPAAGADPVLERYGQLLGGKWLGYLSSTGVYGDTGGAWVDESAPTGGGRRGARALADRRWLERGARVFRLPGIYGPALGSHPGRSALDRVLAGTAHRIALPDQVFGRIHVVDIARAVMLGADGPPGAYNLADDLPCSQNQVIEHACRLLGLAPPPLQTILEADLSPMAREFYAENRRVANGKAKRVLGWRLLYPTYLEGLADCLATMAPAQRHQRTR